MRPGPTAPAARLRGAAAGALTAVLSVAAHSTAGGGLPSGAATALLALLAVTIGALVATMNAAAGVPALVTLLSMGQLLGHAVLGAAGHTHSPVAAAPQGLMLATHAAAIAVGAALIAMGGHLCTALSRVLLASRPPAHRPIAVSAIVFGSADQPRQSALRLAASVSHRGPPVSCAR